MEKKQWYMIGTVGLVLMFVFEMVAMGYLGSHADTPGSTGGSATGVTLQGDVLANVTIARYEPYIIVKGGNSSAVEAAKASLIGSGIADYATKSADGLIISLKESKSAPAAAAKFEGTNATVLATVYVSMPSSVRVAGDGITTNAQGTSFSTQLKPVYEEGSKQEASFLAAVENGVVVGLGNFRILPRSFSAVPVMAELSPERVSTYTVEVPWQYRAMAKPIAVSRNATYRERSYFTVPRGIAPGTLSLFTQLPYVTGVQDGIVSVKNDFSDEGSVALQIATLNITPGFPPSIATFDGILANESALSLVSGLADVNVTANSVVESKVKARLPEYIEAGGAKFETGGKTLLFNATNLPENSTEISLLVDFTADGGKVVSIIGARISG